MAERFPLSAQRRMRDSNPRGLAPNPLSNSAPGCFGEFADVHLSLHQRRSITDERQRTLTIETRIETTLMIKSRGDTSKQRHGRIAPRVPVSAAATSGCSRDPRWEHLASQDHSLLKQPDWSESSPLAAVHAAAARHVTAMARFGLFIGGARARSSS
jgi:hypothetical protein